MRAPINSHLTTKNIAGFSTVGHTAMVAVGSQGHSLPYS
jgi:hypothetical protein